MKNVILCSLFILLGAISIMQGGYEILYGTQLFGPIINISLGIAMVSIFGILGTILYSLKKFLAKG